MQENSQHINKNIGLLVFPLRNPDEEYQGLILQFIALLAPLVRELSLITGNFHTNLPYDNVSVINVKTSVIKVAKESVISKAYRFLLAQFTLSKALIEQSTRVDIVILYLSAGLLFLPVLCARILGKKVVVIITGSAPQSLRAMYPGLPGRIYSMVTRWVEYFDYSLAHRIIVYSESMITTMELERWKDKISVSPRHFLDFSKFKIETPLNRRDCLIGYIGRLTAEKGVVELARAIPLVLTRKDNVRFIVIGNGPLRKQIERELGESGFINSVEFTGWLSKENVPRYLNEIKFLVLPSHTEGIPNVILEAMACGAIVIASRVGGIPDIIVDDETGFLLNDNHPETIANKVIEVYDHPGLANIQARARDFVESNFTYEKALETYKLMIQNLG